jgi:hypothetical protein
MAVKISVKERNVVIKTIALVLIFLGIDYGAEWGAAEFSKKETQRNTSLKNNRQNLQQRLASIQDEERLQNRYAQIYRDWQERGVLDDEDRLQWVEVLQQIQTEREFFPISYQIDAQKSYPTEYSAYTKDSSVKIKSSAMDLRMEMLHVLDMLLFMEDYQKATNIAFIPVHCRMERKSEKFAAVNRGHVNSECKIEWITVEDPDRGKSRQGAQS